MKKNKMNKIRLIGLFIVVIIIISTLFVFSLSISACYAKRTDYLKELEMKVGYDAITRRTYLLDESIVTSKNNINPIVFEILDFDLVAAVVADCPDWGDGLVCDPDMFEGAVTCSEPYMNGKCFECVKCLDINNNIVGQDCRWVCDPIVVDNPNGYSNIL